MRTKQDSQGALRFQRAMLALTAEYHAKYEEFDRILRGTPKILDLVHSDLEEALENESRQRDRKCEFTSGNVLRILLVKTIESETFRGVTVRIDDSDFLRWFTQINGKEMMHFSQLNKLANCIQPETWSEINKLLGAYAVENDLIEGEKLRLDTTAVETNIHYPTDSTLLWDVYRVLAKLLKEARELYPEKVGKRRLQSKLAKKLSVSIGRQSRAKGTQSKKLRKPYSRLIRLVEAAIAWAEDVVHAIEKLIKMRGDRQRVCAVSEALVSELRVFSELGKRIVDQARRRVLNGEQVPNDNKLFSIFEAHTELLKRGKAGKPIEFGHMVLFQQVDGTFISDYRVFEKKPVEHLLVDQAIDNHEELFGGPPKVLTADKGFYESMDKIKDLEERVELVAIAKKGARNPEESARENDILFKIAQAFRAGIEGSISFLKRCFRLFRCFNKSFAHYAATVGLTVFAHNLVVLARNRT